MTLQSGCFTMTERMPVPGYVPNMNSSLPEMKSWVGYTEADAARLKALVPVMEPHVCRIIDRFYDELIESMTAARLPHYFN